ncbi:MAG: NAD(P)-dependent oxidoreductase [Hyphomonadaceae bacterium]
MKVCVLGATGRSGQRIARTLTARGHDVTVIVRDADKAASLSAGRVHIVAVSFEDKAALTAAMRGHDAVINSAGYISDGADYLTLVQRIVCCADAALGPSGRFWLFGGAALLDVPGTSITTLDLPGVPPTFEAHRTNYKAVSATGLDWSMLCPGPMKDAPDNAPQRDLTTSANVWPFAPPPMASMLPRPALSLAFMAAMPRLTIYYEDAAVLIADNLAVNGPYSRCRVGVALAA